jgi:hypothetical protein
MATKFITVSVETMRDKNLSPNQKFILSEIQQLSTLDKGCFANNRHFSELIGISNSGVSKAITGLEKLGYISIDNSKTKRNNGRIITIDFSQGGIDCSQGGIDCSQGGIDCSQESKDNITINRTINIKNKQKDEVLPENLNIEAFNSWCDYKGKSYSKQGRTLTINKLTKYSKDVQQQMVDNSIMNNYKGLFEVKQNNQQKQSQQNTYETKSQRNARLLNEAFDMGNRNNLGVIL